MMMGKFVFVIFHCVISTITRTSTLENSSIVRTLFDLFVASVGEMKSYLGVERDGPLLHEGFLW